MFPKVVCDLCSRSFKNRASLRVHKTNFHRTKDSLKDNLLSKTSERTGPPSRLGLQVKLTNAQLVDNVIDKKKGELAPEIWKRLKRQTQSEIKRQKEEGTVKPLPPGFSPPKGTIETPEDPESLLVKRRRIVSDTDESSDTPVLRKAMKKTKYRKKRSRRQKAIESANDTDISWDTQADSEANVKSSATEQDTDLTDATADTGADTADTDVESTKSDATVVNNGRFYGDDGTALPVNRDTDDTLSNDDAIVPYEPDTDDTLANEDAIVPYKPSEDTDDTDDNTDTVVPYKDVSSDEEVLQPFLEKPVLTGTNETLADGSLVPFVEPVLITNIPPPRTITVEYRCNFCFDVFKSRDVLANHVKKNHPFRCNQCMRTFNTE